MIFEYFVVEKYTINKNFLLLMVFFCFLFTKTIFSEKAIHGIIERGRTGRYFILCSEGCEKYKKEVKTVLFLRRIKC